MSEQRCRDLRVEHERRPFAVASPQPRFSWVADHAQTHYRIEVFDRTAAPVWDSGRVADTAGTLVAYAGRPLAPLEDYTWRVTSWSIDQELRGESRFGTAPDLARWQAPWIEPVQSPTALERWSLIDWIRGSGPATPSDERLRPVQLVRQRIEPTQTPVRARLTMTARGVYSAWLGGERIGDEVLAPGFDSYRHRLSVQTYDVTEHLQAGSTVLCITLADGWWAGRIGLTGSSAQFGDRTSVTWELHLTMPDGRVDIVRAGADAVSAAGPWTYADLFVGERYDARRAQDWTSTAFDDSEWTPVTVHKGKLSPLVAFSGEPIRRVMELPAWTLTHTIDGIIVDFGQVIAGRVRLHIPRVAPGTEVSIEHTETLDAQGNWFTNISGINKEQTDVYISDGRAAEWEPEFTFHGFRYARIRGLRALTTADITAIVISSDLEYTGRFDTSDDRLNRLHENVVWSQRGNFLSVPTDCPQRERAGWTGDMQVFAAAATNIARVTPFVTRWLENLRADQLPDGRVPIFSPRSTFDDEAVATGAGFGSIVAAAGWSDAIAIVPWTLYERTGDVRILEENYPAIQAWIGFQTATAADELPPSLASEALSPERRARQRLLYNTGEHFGDWLTPSTMEGKPTHEAIGIAPALTSELVAPMFQAHTLTLASRIAAVLGRVEERRDYATRANAVRDAFAHEYVGNDASLPVDLQGMYALALGLDMIPIPLRSAASDRLVDLVHARGDRLDTGFLSMPYLLDALWDAGHRELARTVLWQDQSPSWLYEVDHGATTIWESWDAIAPDGSVREMSLNHYAFGCVDDFLVRRLAGIAPSAPGWRRALIAPDIEAPLDRVSGAVDTPFGEIATSWHRRNGVVDVEVLLPFGIDAELVLPDRTVALQPGRNVLTTALPTRLAV